MPKLRVVKVKILENSSATALQTALEDWVLNGESSETAEDVEDREFLDWSYRHDGTTHRIAILWTQ